MVLWFWFFGSGPVSPALCQTAVIIERGSEAQRSAAPAPAVKLWARGESGSASSASICPPLKPPIATLERFPPSHSGLCQISPLLPTFPGT